MNDLFGEHDPTCLVCGRTDCTHFPPDNHWRDLRALAAGEHVVAPEDVWIDTAPGARQRIITKGEILEPGIGAKYGWGKPPVQNAPEGPRRRKPPARKSAVA